MSSFRIKGFSTLSAVLQEVSSFEGRVALIAGGTDLIPRMRNRGTEWDLLVDISQVEDMRYIREEDGRIRIGACTTFAEIASSPLIRAKAACLAQAASQVGSVQIRNRATLAGNIANASPAADGLPPLTVLDAVADLLTWHPGRTVGGMEFPINVCTTRPLVQTLVREIHFPTPSGNCRSGFVKLGSRSAVSVAKLSMAMKVHFDKRTGRIEEGVVALGALGEEPVCPDDLRDFLAGKTVDAAFAKALVRRLMDVVDSAIPDRASRPYKRSAVRGLALDMLKNLFDVSFDLD